MNNREKLVRDLNGLPVSWLRTFKLMYGRNNGRRSVEDTVAMPIADVVSEIPDGRLDWAMQQVSRSIDNEFKEDIL